MRNNEGMGIHYDKTHPGAPWRARMRSGEKRIDLGWYQTKYEASIAYKAARKVCPFKVAPRPPIPENERQAIRETYEQVQSQQRTAEIHGVSKVLVWKILREGQTGLGLDPREPVGDEY